MAGIAFWQWSWGQMNDNDILILLISVLRTGFTGLSLPDIGIKQSYQPTAQGVPLDPTLFIHKVMAPRYGFPGRFSTYNTMTANFDTVESIWRTPTFQISALAVQNPANVNSLTASDYAEMAADVLQTEATRQTLLQSDVGIYRIMTVRPAYFVNERDRFEQEASFDVTLTHKREFTLTTPAVTATEAEIHRV